MSNFDRLKIYGNIWPRSEGKAEFPNEKIALRYEQYKRSF